MRNSPLEWIRGCAAFYVVLSHYFRIDGLAERVGPFAAFLQFGTEAVIVFFLLSGAVIRLSVESRPKLRLEFLRSRAIRILPLFWFAVAFTLFVQWVSPQPADSWDIVAGNLFMLQTWEGFIVRPVLFDNALWSLSFEAFFYVCYALTIG